MVICGEQMLIPVPT